MSLNLALRIFNILDGVSEEAWAEHALKFVNDYNATLMTHGVFAVYQSSSATMDSTRCKGPFHL